MVEAKKPVFTQVDPKVQRWRESGAYLPEFMRDFNGQKEVFKTMHTLMQGAGNLNPILPEQEVISWVEGQVYVIDKFLWFMARHGYTLQRSRAKLNFESLGEKIAELTRMRNEAFAAMLQSQAGNLSETQKD